MLPFKWNWKSSAQTITLINDIREEPHSILGRGPDFPDFRDFFVLLCQTEQIFQSNVSKKLSVSKHN